MRPFERVYTETDYYDGPRGGIACFDGRPHLYKSVFNDREGYRDVFELRAVDDETFQLALEDWEISLRWEDAFRAGKTAQTTHPALPADRARHDEIAVLLSRKLEALPGPVILAKAEFRATPNQEAVGRGGWLEVRWEPST